jgi:beta-lactam-binding protein with PASTA domain
VTATSTASPSQAGAAKVSAEATVGRSVIVPDAVGMNYQVAQDIWRSAGLAVLPANDALGANRIPVLDSNWVVLAQSPKPGTLVPHSSGITATVKKYTDK